MAINDLDLDSLRDMINQTEPGEPMLLIKEFVVGLVARLDAAEAKTDTLLPCGCCWASEVGE